MKQVITAKLKIEHTNEQAYRLTSLCRDYKSALNYASQKAFELGKTSSASVIQKATYEVIREKWNRIPSTMVCGIAKQVGSTYKTLWTRAKQHKSHKAKGWTKKKYKGLDKAPKFGALTATLYYGKDFSWSKDQTVSVATLDGRIKLKYHGWNQHLEFIKSGARCGASKLWYDKTSKQWYLLVSIEIEKPDVDPSKIGVVKGVDVGQRNLAVASSNTGKKDFYNGNKVKHKCREFSKVRSGLQEKGTRSANRVLTRLAMRERRFRTDVNHKISYGLMEQNIIIGMENLKDIKVRTMTRRKRGKFASDKQRHANKEHSSWSYAELQNFVGYKVFFYNSLMLKIDPYNTSKMCNKCGHVSDNNRPNGSIIFRCEECGHAIHSDLNASDNIKDKTIAMRHDLIAMGQLSSVPQVSSNDRCETMGAM
ncbi:MAG: transposase, partial [Patescibacteria group bacterium]